MSSQETFLARVRRAMQKEETPAASRAPLLWHHNDIAADAAALTIRLEGQRVALRERVQHELSSVSGVVTRARSAVEVVQYVTRLAQEKEVNMVVRWQSTLLDTLEINTALQQQGVTVHTTTPPANPGTPAAAATMTARRQELRQLLAHAGMGLSGVDYVIAETGTLVLQAFTGQMRGVSLVPPVHVAVARTSQVLATLADFLLLTQAASADLQQQLTSCTSFITGPSRTADIELQLTVGVHGPKELHLILLDEPTDA